MQFWYMQLHPTDMGDVYSPELMLNVLKKHHVIGLGNEEQWTDDRGQIALFRNEMTIGDIVMASHGKKYFALVMVVGDWENRNADEAWENEDGVWFGVTRKVKILSVDSKSYRERYDKIYGRLASQSHANLRQTLCRWRENKFIEFWYNSLVKEGMTPNSPEPDIEVEDCILVQVNDDEEEEENLRNDLPTELAQFAPELNDMTETERKSESTRRKGQDKLRQYLLEVRHSCEVSGLAIPELLRVSHIKAWADSTNAERLDPENAMLLAANYDAAFDKYLISFDPNTRRLIKSSRISVEELRLIGINLAASIMPPSSKRKEYLTWHLQKMKALDAKQPK